MKTPRISHFFSFKRFTDDLMPFLFAEFQANQAKHLVLSAWWCERTLKEPDFLPQLQQLLKNAGLALSGAHAPFGRNYDLNAACPEKQQHLLKEHSKLLQLAADAGAESYTMHIGEFLPEYTREEQRSAACRAIEKLLQTAEKHRIVLAIENAEHPGGAWQELLFYRTKFASAYFAFCYDSGHAHLTDPDSNKFETLNALLPDIFCAHLHDNDGKLDTHCLPGAGTIPWQQLMPKLLSAPRLQSIQNEVNTVGYAVAIKTVCECFAKLCQK